MLNVLSKDTNKNKPLTCFSLNDLFVFFLRILCLTMVKTFFLVFSLLVVLANGFIFWGPWVNFSRPSLPAWNTQVLNSTSGGWKCYLIWQTAAHSGHASIKTGKLQLTTSLLVPLVIGLACLKGCKTAKEALSHTPCLLAASRDWKNLLPWQAPKSTRY